MRTTLSLHSTFRKPSLDREFMEWRGARNLTSEGSKTEEVEAGIRSSESECVSMSRGLQRLLWLPYDTYWLWKITLVVSYILYCWYDVASPATLMNSISQQLASHSVVLDMKNVLYKINRNGWFNKENTARACDLTVLSKYNAFCNAFICFIKANYTFVWANFYYTKEIWNT